MSDKKGMIEIAAFWLARDARNNAYMSGSALGKGKLLIFKNDFKKPGSKEPDYRLFIVPNEKREEKADTEDDRSDSGDWP